MANIIRKVITVQGDSLPMITGGMSKVGFGVTGTWVGTLTFQGSNDGLNFFNMGGVQAFPIVGTTRQNTTTANGNFVADVANLVAWRILVGTLTSGSPIITIATSVDASYQDAFLAASSIAVSQKVASGANTVTIAAQVNRAWRLRTLSVSFATAPAASVDIQVQDGGSTVLWEGVVPANPNPGYAGGGTWLAPLPIESPLPGLSGGGIVNTPGNSMVIVLASPGAIVNTINAELHPA